MTRCDARGYHVRPGDGNGTNSESILWAERCRDCGAPLGDWSFEHTAEDFTSSTIPPAGTHGSPDARSSERSEDANPTEANDQPRQQRE